MATTTTGWTPLSGTSNYTTQAAIPSLANTTTANAVTAGPAQTATTQQGNAVTAAVQQAVAQQAAGAQAGMREGAASLAEAQTRELDGNELISRQLTQILGEDSELLQRARSQASDAANGRGLLNSSMAVQAGTAAMIDRATPIAQGNAAAYTNVNDKNLANKQATGLFNASQQQDMSKFNTNEYNQNQQFNANLKQSNNQFNTSQTNSMNQFNANSANETSRFNAGQQNTMTQFNVGEANDTSQFNASQTNSMNQFNTGQINDINQFNAQQTNANSQFNASQTNTILAQMMDQQNKLQLADIEAQYKTLMQADASAMTLYQQSTKNISEILMNPDLNAAAKTAAVNNQNQMLSNGLNMLGSMNNLNLSGLLNFSAPTITDSPTGSTGGSTGLTLNSGDQAYNGSLLANYAGITDKKQIKSLQALPYDKQAAINTAIASKDAFRLAEALTAAGYTSSSTQYKKFTALIK